MSEITVEEYIKTKISTELQPIVGRLQEIMHKYTPESKQVIYYGALMWKRDKVMAWVTPAKAHISLGFYKGNEFKDKHGLLEGTGKASRHVKIKKIEDINEAALEDFIEQSLKLG